MICIGKIVAAQGLRGWVKVRTFTESLDSFLKYRSLFLEDQTKIILTKKEIKADGLLIASIDGIFDRTSAELFVGKSLWIQKDQLSPTKEGEYYYVDLVGLQLFDENDQKIGIVEGVEDFGGGPFLDFIYKGKAATLPFHNESVLLVDVENKKIIVKSEAILC